MSSTHHSNLIRQLSGVFNIPHELLHVIGYRLMGKSCRYRWGERYVTLQGPMKLWERLVGLLFPFVVLAGLCFVSTIFSTVAYRSVLLEGKIFWFIFWTGLALMSGGYAGTAIGDLRQAYLLILDKPWYSWTPFDLFFWPIVDWTEVRENMKKKESDAK